MSRRATLLIAIALAACAEPAAPTHRPGYRLHFLNLPEPAGAGLVLPAVRVSVLDSLNQAATSAAAVTLVIAYGQPNATLAGTTTRVATGGVATFDDLAIHGPAGIYTLAATAPGLIGTTSGVFRVAAGTAARIGILTQPATMLMGEAIPPPVRAGLYDAFDNPVTSAAVSITLALEGGPEGATLEGTTTREAAEGGIAQFHVIPDRTGSGYRLTASGDGLVPATTNEFRVVAELVLSRVTADSQTVFPFVSFDSLRVRVADENARPVEGRVVSWSVTEGPGDMMPTSTLTGADGQAAAWLNAHGDLGAVRAAARLGSDEVHFYVAFELPEWTWQPVAEELSVQFGRILVEPEDERVWYVWQIGDVMRVTHDAGQTWTETTLHGDNPLANGFVNARGVVIDPADPRRVYAGASRTLYRSSDRGLSWQPIQTFDRYNRSLLVARQAGRGQNDGFIYFAPQSPLAAENPTTPPGIYRSTDDGASFEHIAFDMPLGTAVLPWDIAEHPITGTLFIAAEIADHPSPYRPPFLRSTDRGQTWHNVAQPGWWHALRIAIDPLNGTVYTQQEGAGLWKSDDDGVTWTRVGTHRFFGLAFLLDPARPHRLFVSNHVFAEWNGDAFISADGGRSFWPLGFSGKPVTGMALNGTGTRLHVVAGGRIYVADVPSAVP
jgi:photosystem II stability/assembly factor-like uncharacterized protein